MDSKQRDFIQTIVHTEVIISQLYGIDKRIVEKYGEDELDEQMVDDIREYVYGRISELSKEQQQAMHNYECYLPEK